MGLLVSCESDYLETDPTTSSSTDLATSTVENMNIAINGMHRNMFVRQNGSQGQNGATGILIYMDILGEDVVFPTTGNGWYVSTLRWQDNANASSGNLYYPYGFFYSIIKNSNILIEAMPKVKVDASNQDMSDRVMGEALAFRAFSYFNLVQIYGKRYVAGSVNSQLGVPLRLDNGFNPIPRNTVEEVYTQVNADLEKAYGLLKGKARSSKSHFDESVVRGIMARVALVQGKYDLAATYANEAKAKFALMSNATYAQGFNNYSNAEWMWGYKIQEDQSDYFGNFMAYMSRNYNSTQIRQAPKVMNSKLFEAFPASDVRTQVVDATGAHASLKLASTYYKFPFTSQKFLSVNKDYATDNNTSLGDVPFMRSAEMYLIEAEALARQGKDAQARTVFALLEKNRNPSYVTTTASGDALLQEILLSRRIELWGEGFRFLDLKRMNLPLDRNGANHDATVVANLFSVPAGDKRWTWLIPQAEINSSQDVIVQNEL